MSVQDIDNKILDIIETVDDSNKQLFMDMFLKQLKTSTKKQGHIKFLEEVLAAQNQISSQADNTDLLNEDDTENVD